LAFHSLAHFPAKGTADRAKVNEQNDAGKNEAEH
jgi:hypothetical protein